MAADAESERRARAVSDEGHGFVAAAGVFTVRVGSGVLTGYRCEYRAAHYRDDLFDYFAIALPPELIDAVAKCRSDYLAGRVCAQRVLTRLGFSPSEARIPFVINRQPIWPAGVAASISHTAGVAVCLATTAPDVLGVGIDIEHEMQLDLATDINRQIVETGEDLVIRRHFDTYSRGLTVVFSAKESIYKAAYRLVGRFFGFSAARLARIDADTMVFTVAEPLGECLPVGFPIKVHYTITGEEVQTVTCLSRG